jgi:gluconolactonase
VGHNLKQGAVIMPDALRWLWRGYPNPVVVHESAAMGQPGWDPRDKAYSTVFVDKPWEQVGATYSLVASLASDQQGSVFFADPGASRIYKSDSDGKVTLFKDNSSGAQALTVGPDGRLYASQLVTGRIVSYGPGGDEKLVAQKVEATGMAITSHSMIYFADMVHKSDGYIDTNGRTHSASYGGEIAVPSGVALSPDQVMLIVTDAQARYSWPFQIAPGGSLINGEPFYRLEMPEAGWVSGVHAVTEDSIGRIYFARQLAFKYAKQTAA